MWAMLLCGMWRFDRLSVCLKFTGSAVTEGVLAVTYSVTRGQARLRSTPLKSQSSPGNSSVLGKKEMKNRVWEQTAGYMHKITCAKRHTQDTIISVYTHTRCQSWKTHVWKTVTHWRCHPVGPCVSYKISLQAFGLDMFIFWLLTTQHTQAIKFNKYV